MASAIEYLEMLSTCQLQALLREECEGRGNLPRYAILDICDVLSQRLPDVPTVDQLLRQLCGQYLGEG